MKTVVVAARCIAVVHQQNAISTKYKGLYHPKSQAPSRNSSEGFFYEYFQKKSNKNDNIKSGSHSRSQ